MKEMYLDATATMQFVESNIPYYDQCMLIEVSMKPALSVYENMKPFLISWYKKCNKIEESDDDIDLNLECLDQQVPIFQYKIYGNTKERKAYDIIFQAYQTNLQFNKYYKNELFHLSACVLFHVKKELVKGANLQDFYDDSFPSLNHILNMNVFPYERFEYFIQRFQTSEASTEVIHFEVPLDPSHSMIDMPMEIKINDPIHIINHSNFEDNVNVFTFHKLSLPYFILSEDVVEQTITMNLPHFCMDLIKPLVFSKEGVLSGFQKPVEHQASKPHDLNYLNILMQFMIHALHFDEFQTIEELTNIIRDDIMEYTCNEFDPHLHLQHPETTISDLFKIVQDSFYKLKIHMNDNDRFYYNQYFDELNQKYSEMLDKKGILRY